MDANTGKHLTDLAHLRQSIRDILTTPIGSRVMRREYGSRLPELVDAPLNAETTLEIYAATAEALDTWEKRFKLESVHVDAAEEGSFSLTVYGEYRPTGKSITMEGIVI
ncbi:MAG: GPW/gp25 family protein [Desulfovibrio sp.]